MCGHQSGANHGRESHLTDSDRPLDITFTATLGKVREGDTWTCVQMPESVVVSGTIDGEPLDGAFMALGDGTHEVPVTAAARRAIGRTDGESVTVHLTTRRSRGTCLGGGRVAAGMRARTRSIEPHVELRRELFRHAATVESRLTCP